jgi:hypothetical protein
VHVDGRALSVADNYFFVAHNEQTGRARQSHTGVSIGLAAALLADLIIPDHMRVDNGLIKLGYQAAPPPSSLHHWVWETVLAERTRHPVGTWLRFFARDSIQRVGERLTTAGLVRPIDEATVLGLFRKETVYYPADPAFAAYLPVAIRRRLDNPSTLIPQDLALVGLIAATELYRHLLLWDGDRPSPDVFALLKRLPAPLQELIAHTQATFANVVLGR